MTKFFLKNLQHFFVISSMLVAVIGKMNFNELQPGRRTHSVPNTKLQSERRAFLVEDQYITRMYQSGVSENYICTRMARLRRVPLCVRLYQEPHYADDLRVVFNYEAYRNHQPECAEKTLTFRTRPTPRAAVISQQMLLCPGRHDPVRSHYLLDDYADVFYVSSGPRWDALHVYKREWDADREWYYVYQIFVAFPIRSLGMAIVTYYDTERDLEATNRVSYNADAEEIEVVYIREMHKARDPRSERDAQLTGGDTIVDLYENELTTLCFVILDRDAYKKLGFLPRQPTPARSIAAVEPEINQLYFRQSVEYNDQRVVQTMYVCQSSPTDSSLGGASDQSPFRISAGARPFSYFVYARHGGATQQRLFRVHEFVENLTVARIRHNDHVSKLASVARASGPGLSNEIYERMYMNEVRTANTDIVCDQLDPDYITTVCINLFATSHYAEELNMYFNYRAAMYTRFQCKKNRLIFETKEFRNQDIDQNMVICPARHDPFRSGWRYDDFKDVIHISGGRDSNTVTVYWKERNADTEWHRVYQVAVIDSPLDMPPTTITLADIAQEHAHTLVWSFNQNIYEIEIIYIREMVSTTIEVVEDVLASQSKIVLATICYTALDREPDKEMGYQLSEDAFNSSKVEKGLNNIVFAYFLDHNDEQRDQVMYPCFVRYTKSNNERQLDTHFEQFQISSGARPNSFFMYSLQQLDSQYKYKLHMFIENVNIHKLKPLDNNEEKVQNKEQAISDSKERILQPLNQTTELGNLN